MKKIVVTYTSTNEKDINQIIKSLIKSRLEKTNIKTTA